MEVVNHYKPYELSLVNYFYAKKKLHNMKGRTINEGQRTFPDCPEEITIYDVMKMEGAKQFLDSISRNSKKSAKTYSGSFTISKVPKF